MDEKNIKNVLSVDIDYIMAPCIQLYNDMSGQISSSFNAEEFWCKVQKERYLNEYLHYDVDKFNFIKKLLFKSCKNISKENIYFGKEHDSILTFLCQDKEKKDYQFNVFNVDHHHDIFYGNNQRSEVERFNFATLSNWVWYLFTNKKLNRYYWINNESSQLEIEDDKVLCHLPFERMNYFYNKENELLDVEFDYVYFCKSERFFPLKFYDLYYSIIDEINELKGHHYDIDYKVYCLNNKSRNPIT